MEQPPENYQQPHVVSYGNEGDISNIVGQIDPASIVDNLNHSLKGEFYNKENGKWEMTSSKQPLVNDACRGFLISYVTGVLNNNSTLAVITKEQLGLLMESVIKEINKEFTCNLELFGFVPKGQGYGIGIYENKGTPDSARMSSVSGMVFRALFSCYTRAVNGMESRKIFGSLRMSDGLDFGNSGGGQQGGSWVGKMFGG